MRPRAMQLEGGPLAPPSLVGVMILLDRSGSMSEISDAMRRAFGDFVQQQRAVDDGGMWLTLHQFDNDGYDVVYERRPLGEVPPLVLQPRGGTPLRDALCRFAWAARQIANDSQDLTDRLLLVVITDGRENASQVYTWADVRGHLAQVEGPDCEVIWLGTTAAILEVEEEMPAMRADGATLAYDASRAGVAYMGQGLTTATTAWRAGHSARQASHAYATSGGTATAEEIVAALAKATRRE